MSINGIRDGANTGDYRRMDKLQAHPPQASVGPEVFPSYRSYGYSGEDWLGDIPSTWTVKKLKWLVEIRKRIAGYEGPDVLSITQRGIKVKDIKSGEGQLAANYSAYQYVYRGEFAMNHMDLLTGYVDISKYDGVVSPDYRVFKNIGTEVTSEYLLLLFQMGYHQKIFFRFGQGVSLLGRWRLPADSFYEFAIPIPPLPEQKNIASFLDQKTTKIDQAITIKEQQIALLKERKQIIIQQAVTRGLNSNVSMKDSGIEWIGEIPTHWDVLPLTKYSSRVDYRGKTPEKVGEGRFLLTAKNIRNGGIDYEVSKEFMRETKYEYVMSRGKPRIGDLLFTTEAPLGNTALVDDPKVAIAQRIIKFRFSNNVDSTYVNYFMQSAKFQHNLQSHGTGSTALGIKASKLCLLRILCPPLEEQNAVCLHLNQELQKLELAISLKHNQISRLEEYKTTLINAAVTGKIKVA